MSDPNRDRLEFGLHEQTHLPAHAGDSPRHAAVIGPNERRISNRLAVGLYALAAVVGVGLIEGKAGGHENFYNTAKAFASFGSQCPAASDSAKHTVATMFPLEDGPSYESSADTTTMLQRYDPEDYQFVKKFFEDSRLEKPKLPIQDYVAMANKIDTQVGMEFSIPEDIEQTSSVGPLLVESIAADSAEARDIRSAIAQHALDVVRQPKEFLRYLGISHVKLVDIKAPEIVGYLDQKHPDSILLDPKALPQTTIHEGWHRKEHATCGGILGMMNDKVYEDLNPENIYISLETFLQFEDCKNKNKYSSQKVEDVCGKDYDKVAKGLVAGTYGLVAPHEDRANLIEKFSSVDGFIYVFGEDNTLRKKGIELMGRIYDDEPELVDYFASVYAEQRMIFSSDSRVVSVN